MLNFYTEYKLFADIGREISQTTEVLMSNLSEQQSSSDILGLHNSFVESANFFAISHDTWADSMNRYQADFLWVINKLEQNVDEILIHHLHSWSDEDEICKLFPKPLPS